MKNVGLSDLQKDSMHAWKAKKGEHKSRFSILIQNTLVMDGDGLQRNKEVETFFLVVGTQTYTSTTVFKIMIFFVLTRRRVATTYYCFHTWLLGYKLLSYPLREAKVGEQLSQNYD